MNPSREWIAPLTGVAFVVVGIIGFIVGGEPKDADRPAQEIVQWYVDNKDSAQAGAVIGAAAGLLLIFFGAYLRSVLQAAAGVGSILPIVSFIGLVIVALGFAIDGTILFANAEAADQDSVDPVAVQALQALWDNDFIPILLGAAAFLWATGIAIIRTAVFPVWLGWLMIVLGVISFTPIGFVSAIGAALIVLALSIVLTLRARAAAMPPVPPPPPAPAV
jgi:hypothetical protein